MDFSSPYVLSGTIFVVILPLVNSVALIVRMRYSFAEAFTYLIGFCRIGNRVSPTMNFADRYSMSAARAAWFTCGITLCACIIYGAQLFEMHRQLSEAKDDRRAWLSVEPKFHADIMDNGNGATLFPINFKIKNVGKSPAFDISLVWEPVATPFLKVHQISDDQFPMTCLPPFRKLQINEGTWLPPGDSLEDENDSVFMLHNSYLKEAATKDEWAGFWIVIVGCVKYRTGTDDTVHFTPIQFEVSRWLPSSPTAQVGFKFSKDMRFALETLRIKRSQIPKFRPD